MTRPLGKFIYTMNNCGYMVGKIVSGVAIYQNDALHYNGNRLYVVSKNNDVLEVRKTGYLINVETFED